MAALGKVWEVLQEKVGNLIRYREHNVKVEVELMRSELMMMKSYIKDADARESEKEQDRGWFRAFRALAYRIENVIETFDIGVGRSRTEMSTKESRYERVVKKFNFSDIKYVASRAAQLEIDDIRKELKGFLMFRDLFGILMTSNYDKERMQYSLSRRMSADGGLLFSSMFEEDRNHQIICIGGGVDIFRSFLARQLCNDERIAQHFQAIAWVDGPPASSTRVTFRRTSSRTATKYIEGRKLAQRLLSFQEKKKKRPRLIVLNNIHSTDVFEELLSAFPSGNPGSRILITTGSPQVEERIAAAGNGSVRTMWSPTEEDAWELLSNYVSARDGTATVNWEMENMGRNLVTLREVLNPAILAERLKIMYESGDWKIVNENGEESEEAGRVQQALASKYNDLPYQLKLCFFYLATFLKDTEIEPEKLYHLWMAESLLSSDNNRSETMMDMAEKCLDQLRLRGIVDVQEEEVTTARKFKSCSLHNSIRNFCLLMGRQEELFVVMEHGVVITNGIFSALRLVINAGQYDDVHYLYCFHKELRCLLVRELDNQEMLTNIIERIMECKYLRILVFDRIDFGSRSLPKRFADVVLLRYLSFTECLLKALPASVCKFPFLQILDLRVRTECEMEIPNVLWKMKRLRHLYLPLKFRTCVHDKLRLNGLTQLETLENFNTVLCDVNDLFTLTKISYLTVNIEGSLEGLRELADHMKKREVHLSLNIENFDCYAKERHSVFAQLLACPALHILYMEGHLGNLPPYHEESVNLTKIVLSRSELQIDPMPSLGMLQKLRMLILTNDAIVGEKIIISESNFPQLRHLELSNLFRLKRWEVEGTALPLLSILTIKNCSQLKMLPDGLRLLQNFREQKSQPEMLPDGFRFLRNFGELKILRMPEEFKCRLLEVYDVPGADNDNESSQ